LFCEKTPCSLEADSLVPAQDGITHIFVSEFDSPEDKAYYLDEDPAYAAFCKSIEDVVEKKQVVDFCPGQFTTRVR